MENIIIAQRATPYHYSIGMITLNRVSALNALNLDMCDAISKALVRWEKDDSIKAVMIKSASPKAFCAGGDVRALYEEKHNGTLTLPHPFFACEYRMNRLLFHFSKPYIALLDGITMGGGAGIAIHGSHRVATPRCRFAMPETGIGFFPDIGAAYFLTRCPYKLGWYLGLTGVTIDAEDAAASGLFNYYVKPDALSHIEQALYDMDLSEEAYDKITQLVTSRTYALSHSTSRIWAHRQIIERCFSKASVADIVKALQTENSDFSQQTLALLRQRSPTSLMVTYEQLRRAGAMDFDAVSQMDHKLALQFLRSHDFYEGVRAALIDKDKQPHWMPSTLAQVKEEMVNTYFENL